MRGYFSPVTRTDRMQIVLTMDTSKERMLLNSFLNASLDPDYQLRVTGVSYSSHEGPTAFNFCFVKMPKKSFWRRLKDLVCP